MGRRLYYFVIFYMEKWQAKMLSKTSELFERNDGANAPVTDHRWYARMMIDIMTIPTI